MRVNFFKINTNKENQKLYGYITLNSNKVNLSNIPKKLSTILQEGIHFENRILYPQDGEKFMEVLPKVFTGSILRAELIKGILK